MKLRRNAERGRRILPLVITTLVACLWQSQAAASDLEVKGFVDTANYYRDDFDWTKNRFTAQLELSKAFKPRGIFSELSIHSTLRGSYDAVYDINDDEYGKNAGGPITFQAPGNPALATQLGVPFPVSTNPQYGGVFPPPPFGPPFGGTGAIPLPGVPGGTLFGGTNVNDGLKFAAGDVYNYGDGGVILATPARPCDIDNRGCNLNDYMDFSENDLKWADFNDRLDWLRELYIDATIPFDNGDELAMRFGRQQVVWGRTDLFRVLDVVNPIDFSRNNLYDEFEDSRIPMGILTTEYRFGATNTFEDINVQLLWKWEKPRPHDLGQGGEPYAILGAGNLFRALNNCWDNGCTVGNFPATGVTVDFPAHSIGIREADTKDWGDTEYGARLEGVYKGVGFSFNVLSYYSQFPVLRGGIAADDPFTPQVENEFFPYNIAFDIKFPRLLMYGGSADFYVDPLKAAFRVELAMTEGEEFPDTSVPTLSSESDVLRWVVGIDRPTFIPFLNKKRAFLISVQAFGEHILDHHTTNVNSIGLPTQSEIGFQHWEDNYLFTLLFQGNYLNDRLTPQIIMAYDHKAESGTVSPGIDWKPSNKWRVIANFNIKVGDGAIAADDNRGANPFPGNPFAPTTLSSTGVQGFEPLGRFRSGPIGTAIQEDEFQLTVRYQF
ncbi:MAG: DUF1302 family protein [Pseudomonadales bacterium]